jgi:hypothetical protein
MSYINTTTASIFTSFPELLEVVPTNPDSFEFAGGNWAVEGQLVLPIINGLYGELAAAHRSVSPTRDRNVIEGAEDTGPYFRGDRAREAEDALQKLEHGLGVALGYAQHLANIPDTGWLGGFDITAWAPVRPEDAAARAAVQAGGDLTPLILAGRVVPVTERVTPLKDFTRWLQEAGGRSNSVWFKNQCAYLRAVGVEVEHADVEESKKYINDVVKDTPTIGDTSASRLKLAASRKADWLWTDIKSKADAAILKAKAGGYEPSLPQVLRKPMDKAWELLTWSAALQADVANYKDSPEYLVAAVEKDLATAKKAAVAELREALAAKAMAEIKAKKAEIDALRAEAEAIRASLKP